MKCIFINPIKLRGIISNVSSETDVYDEYFYMNFPIVARFRGLVLTTGELVNLGNNPN